MEAQAGALYRRRQAASTYGWIWAGAEHDTDTWDESLALHEHEEAHAENGREEGQGLLMRWRARWQIRLLRWLGWI
jgi:hypothetical protein